MKSSNVLLFSILLICFANVPVAGFSQHNKLNADSCKARIYDTAFTFVPQTMIPQKGSPRFLTDEYELRIRKDSMQSSLPYFGESYVAPMDPSKGLLDFNCSIASYTISNGKKNSWQIIITPKNAANVQQMAFTVFDNASATLNVTLTNSYNISFEGNIK